MSEARLWLITLLLVAVMLASALLASRITPFPFFQGEVAADSN
jgi:hypothetical protein